MDKKALRENIMIIFTIIIVVLAVAGIESNKNVKTENAYKNDVKEESITPSLINPDRIIYKMGGKDEYYIFEKEDKEKYNDILTEILKGITGLSDGESITDEEVAKYQENENCIILDYNTASKNYLIRLNSNDASVLKQKESGWQVVKRIIVNKLDIQKTIDKSIKNSISYTMKENKNYLSKNTLKEIPNEYKEILKKKDNISYYMVIKDFETLSKFNMDFNVAIDKEFIEDTFKDNNIIVLVTKGTVKEIKTNIGHVKYYINYEEYNGYMVNEYQVSKVVNSNCIYTELKENDIIKNNDGYILKNDIEYISAISKSLMKSTDIKELNLQSKGNKTYSKIATKEEMIDIVNKLELKCISEMNFYNDFSKKFTEDAKYIVLLKNAKGRFSIKALEYSEIYGGIPIDRDINLNIFDISNNNSKNELKCIIIKLPNELEINDIKLNRIQINRNKIINNKLNITEAQAIDIAKKSINDTDDSRQYQVYTDIVVNTNDFYRQQFRSDLEKVESLVEAYVVCRIPKEDENLVVQQIIINVQTGEIISNDELPC